jgi:hypothetical protein
VLALRELFPSRVAYYLKVCTFMKKDDPWYVKAIEDEIWKKLK